MTDKDVSCSRFFDGLLLVFLIEDDIKGTPYLCTDVFDEAAVDCEAFAGIAVHSWGQKHIKSHTRSATTSLATL